jgi:hypothetical protein
VEYERIRPLVLFGESVPKRARETGPSERTLYRRISGFEQEGMQSLFGSPPAKRRRILPNSIRRLILDLKAEHPALNNSEIANICYVFSGRKPDVRSVGNILDETPIPLRKRSGVSIRTTRYRMPGSAGKPSSRCTTRGGRTRA